MTLGDAKAQLRLRGVTINKTQAGDYRVNFLHGIEATACYEATIVDAYGTGLAMAARQQISGCSCQGCMMKAHRVIR